jgi:hypothetical protein
MTNWMFMHSVQTTLFQYMIILVPVSHIIHVLSGHHSLCVFLRKSLNEFCIWGCHINAAKDSSLFRILCYVDWSVVAHILKALWAFETLVIIYQLTCQHIQGDLHLHHWIRFEVLWFSCFHIVSMPLLCQCNYSLKNHVSYSLPFSTEKVFTVTCSWLYFPVGIQCEKRYFQMEFYLTLVSNRQSAQIQRSSLARQRMHLELMTLASTWSFKVR